MEILWLLTKTWNCGIHQYRYHYYNMDHYNNNMWMWFSLIVCSLQRYKEAEQWCTVGMKFLKFLTQLRASYEDQVTPPIHPPSITKSLSMLLFSFHRCQLYIQRFWLNFKVMVPVKPLLYNS